MNKKFPLVVEPHPEDYDGYEFITLIRFNDESFLNIIDNISKKYIYSYVIDLCGPENFSEEDLIRIAYEWYDSNGDRYPISVEFSKRNLVEEASSIFRAFPIDYVTRVIGPLPQFNMNGPNKVRKRKRKEVPEGIEIVYKPLTSGTL
jgi:hypothetical protein